MKTRIITGDDVSRIVARVGADQLMDQVIAAMVEFCLLPGDLTEARPRDGFHYTEPQVGLLEWMTTLKKGEESTIKVVGYHPQNPVLNGVPTIIANISVYDARTGAMLALADGTLATAIRTGAASAVVSQIVADPDSSVLGIIGCGAQAITQCHALMRCFPIDRILVYDSVMANQMSFKKRLSKICSTAVKVEIVPQAEILARAQILCTCTSVGIGEGPLFTASTSTLSNLHINAVGSDFPGKVELPKKLLERATVIPDCREQCIQEGECQQIEPAHIGPDLRQVVTESQKYECLRDELTVFDSTGWSVEDQVIMDIIVEHAQRLNIGECISLHLKPTDPLSPYEF